MPRHRGQTHMMAASTDTEAFGSEATRLPSLACHMFVTNMKFSQCGIKAVPPQVLLWCL